MRFLLLIVVAGLVGCATAYQPSGATGGFSEMQRGEFTYLIRFDGNGYTRQSSAEEMVFLRAAELTLAKGFTFFAVLNESSSVSSSSYTTPAQSFTQGSMDRFGNYRGRTTTYGGQTVEIDRPSTRLLIGVSNEKFGSYDWVEAQRVVNDLGPKYKQPTPAAAGTQTPASGSCFLNTQGRCSPR